MRAKAWIFLFVLSAAAMGGCMHVKGVVLDDRSNQPMRSAVFTVGRPNGIAVLDRHAVDSGGRFDFYLLPTDADDLFLHDSMADPEFTMRRVDPSEINDHMKLLLRPAPRQNPGDDMGGTGLPAD